MKSNSGSRSSAPVTLGPIASNAALVAANTVKGPSPDSVAARSVSSSRPANVENWESLEITSVRRSRSDEATVEVVVEAGVEVRVEPSASVGAVSVLPSGAADAAPVDSRQVSSTSIDETPCRFAMAATASTGIATAPASTHLNSPSWPEK